MSILMAEQNIGHHALTIADRNYAMRDAGQVGTDGEGGHINAPQHR
jgi:ABC-type branched-subunit amino acid transport system ATPase component